MMWSSRSLRRQAVDVDIMNGMQQLLAPPSFRHRHNQPLQLAVAHQRRLDMSGVNARGTVGGGGSNSRRAPLRDLHSPFSSKFNSGDPSSLARVPPPNMDEINADGQDNPRLLGYLSPSKRARAWSVEQTPTTPNTSVDEDAELDAIRVPAGGSYGDGVVETFKKSKATQEKATTTGGAGKIAAERNKIVGVEGKGEKLAHFLIV